MYWRILFSGICVFIAATSFGQIAPAGTFIDKQVKIGKNIRYSLSIKYPSNQDIIFPDSTYSYAPFEYVEKRFFKTSSDSINSFDSVVYTLSTFDIDSIQYLALPVFLIENDDSTKLFSIPDSIRLTSSITQLPDSAKVFVNTDYIEVQQDFNYSYWLFGLAIFLLLSILFVLIFGKAIIKNIKIKRIRKQYYKFLMSYKELSGSIHMDNYEVYFQEVIALWKSYLQQLTGKPFTSFSTKEIGELIKIDELKDTLQKIDRAIYAHRFPTQHEHLLKLLQEYAYKFYERKISEIKNGPKK